MLSLTGVIRDRGMTRGDAAALFGVTQLPMSNLMRGKINPFSLDTLIGMAATASMGLTVKVSKPKAMPNKHPKRAAKRRLEAAQPFLRQLDPLRNWVEKPVLPWPAGAASLGVAQEILRWTFNQRSTADAN